MLQKFMLIDSHCHVQFPEFDADRDAVAKRALDAGIWMVNIGTNFESSKKAVELARQYKEGVYAAVGIHPHDADADYDFTRLEELARDPKVVGVGETGLDYYRSQNQNDPSADGQNLKIIKEEQKELFIKHIELARKINKPLIIHCREAHDDLLQILQAKIQWVEVQPPFVVSKGSSLGRPSGNIGEVESRGVMHFFGGEGAWENLDKYLEMGFYISLAGVVTFSNYKDAENIKKIPLDRILIETDAPYVAPEPFRGKRNEPAYVKFVAEKIAEIKETSFEEIERQTTFNARRLFKI